MKKEMGTIKNFILLIASALTLVAVTFAWLSISSMNHLKEIDTNIKGSTIAVTFFESQNQGASYTPLTGNLEMNNMAEGVKRYYRMDVKTYDAPIRLIMSFDQLKATNTVARYVYFDYRVVCSDTGEVLSTQTGRRLSDYTSATVFSQDLSALQGSGKKNYSVYYDVYVVPGSENISGTTADLGEVKLLGQQVG